MGKYNPYAPWIVGLEWTGIQPAPYTLDPDVERGYTFTLDTSTTIVSGGIYINEPTPGATTKVGMVSVYRSGEEALTGPIKRVVIPVNAATATFSAGAGGGNVDPGTGFTIPQAVQNSSDGAILIILGNATVDFSFDVLFYSSILDNKRIVDVNVLYSMVGEFGDNSATTSRIYMTKSGGTALNFQEPIGLFGSVSAPRLERHSFGSVNIFTDASNGTNTVQRYPWRYEELSRLDNSDLKWRIHTTTNDTVTTNPSPPLLQVAYVALEVLYCEETRLIVGGKGHSGGAGTAIGTTDIDASFYRGLNTVFMRPTSSLAVTGHTLAPGEYTVTVNMPEVDDVTDSYGGYPRVNALRQRYTIPTHTGVEIIRSLRENGQFTKQSTNIIPAIALYTASGIVTGTHVYGDTPSVSVYNGNNATQEVIQTAGASGVVFTQVRFYARRFGDTNVPLTLFRTSTPTQAVSINPGDFDLLPEIVDGWREITLRFPDTTPTFNNSMTGSQWTWSATNLAAGNQWQILAMYIPYQSGIYNPTKATYGRDVAKVNTTSTIYDAGDAVLFFSQEPPAVSGLAISTASQPVSGISTACSATPDCIPTGINYHYLTWIPTSSLPASAFGYYELQRMDEIDEWQTIAKITNRDVAWFNDYEARVNVTSYYRIRVANLYEFFGVWSATKTSAITAPGITPTIVNNSVLIFTTNEQQDGSSNLAYVMVWDSNVVEEYVFPEASTVEFKRLYRQDYVTAFKPSERGGEQFSRTLLVNNAAVSTNRVRDGFRSLRDLAWSNVAYICVRNELGDRWFAHVQVPGGRIMRNRQQYLARVDITEVTDTSSIVNPTL